jgi:hypothetical protein
MVIGSFLFLPSSLINFMELNGNVPMDVAKEKRRRTPQAAATI